MARSSTRQTGPRPAHHAKRWLQRLQSTGYLLPSALTGYLWLKGLHPALPGWPCPLRAMTGTPCPTCFLTRATSAALGARLEESVALHAFGPIAAAALLWWSVVAIRERRLMPAKLLARPLAWGAAALVAYWLLRLWLSFGLGIRGFPGFPPG